MNFEIGDKVNFICAGVLYEGNVLDVGTKAILVEHANGDRKGYEVWVRESDLALVKLPVVPLYYVVFLPDDEFSYLKYNTIDRTAFVSEKIERDEFKTKFTEEEIKNMDERYWAFAVPAEDLEV
ncbi:DUF1642 domain-containing protein [Listeria monocytogenes]|uniref:DUF1642 domain-containing protein n=1 Tax=Listeria monocytogenes TaxID=1639 RepID=UPI0013890CCF|nr:DUF1642 domain-containing protein [Listeria monocytogenes]EDN9691189.1 DUF1642 domain-containing protein [Listeria monocytogenes]EED2022418.1 DUF1642 domain-containing protein [Listeria monocytogenes]EJB4722688.1 DUF1642 domain-containing protein [Listeria monocytogenes]EKN1181756.1 DUF1642 domain-containing protein [Listeria monocytogenes]MCD7495314.1 DUF1642 domain-containing protein [Listeria monocytogenes]